MPAKYPIFPIQTDTACLLKWSWSTIYFNSGSTASCHRTKKFAIDPDNFDQFHNLPDKVAARTVMLNGQWPADGCQYCQSVEESGGYSDRQFNLYQQENVKLVPPELLTNSKETSITPTIVEVYFKNTCNMACVYCGPHHSSLWEEENRKFDESYGNDATEYSVRLSQFNSNYDRMVNDFWNYLSTDNRYQVIQRYHILGGEPFLLKELDDSIDFWNTHGNPDLTFSIISNLNIPHERFKKYIHQFERLVLRNKIWQLQLTASLDCWGPEQEYVRYGLNLETWLQNFEYCIDRPWISLSINSAISALTIKGLPTLLEKINHWNTQQTKVAGRWQSEPIIHSFNTSGQQDNPYIFGSGVFDNDFEKILQLMPKNNSIQQGRFLAMEGIANKQKNSIRDNIYIENLKTYLDQLDVRRKTNWRTQFGWLDQDFSV